MTQHASAATDGTARPVPTVQEAIGTFGETLTAKSPRTATNYRSALNRFCEFLRDQATRPCRCSAATRCPRSVLEDLLHLAALHPWPRAPAQRRHLRRRRARIHALPRPAALASRRSIVRAYEGRRARTDRHACPIRRPRVETKPRAGRNLCQAGLPVPPCRSTKTRRLAAGAAARQSDPHHALRDRAAPR